MLSDRHYMRYEDAHKGWGACASLMVILVVCFAIQEFSSFHLAAGNFIRDFLALNDLVFAKGYLWQFITFQFLHGGISHLFFNLIALWFFGRTVETYVGQKHFLTIYFSAGLCGGILQAILALAFSNYFGGPCVGASAGISGIMATFCVVEPEATIMLFWVLPIKARYLLRIMLGMSLFFILVPTDRGVAHAGHLGGLLVGIAYIHYGFHGRDVDSFFSAFFNFFKVFKRSKEVKPVLAKSAPPRKKTEPFISQEVDPILDKISAHGIQSLTEEERRILDAARKKMGQ